MAVLGPKRSPPGPGVAAKAPRWAARDALPPLRCGDTARRQRFGRERLREAAVGPFLSILLLKGLFLARNAALLDPIRPPRHRDGPLGTPRHPYGAATPRGASGSGVSVSERPLSAHF